MEQTKYDVFISYSRKDKDQILDFLNQINAALHIDCWMDVNGIESGEEFEDVIVDIIDKCQVVLFMLSDSALQSKWTKREVYYAEGEGKRIIPVVVDGKGVRGWFKFHFGTVDYIDIHSQEHREKLIGNLKNWLGIVDTESNASHTEVLEEPTDPVLQNQLGDDYRYGQNGKEKDFTKAESWYRKAAEKGYAFAQWNLAVLLKKSDFEEACKLFKTAMDQIKKAAELGDMKAQRYLGNYYYDDDDFPYDKSLDEWDFDNPLKEAVRWWLKAAKQGDAEAQFALSWWGEEEEQLFWLQKAAENGLAAAQSNLGSMYYRGNNKVPQDYHEALKWFRKVAESQVPFSWVAWENLGECYENGHGVPQDKDEAQRWYKMAFDQHQKDAEKDDENGFAMLDLGRHYEHGWGVPQDYVKAASCYRKAADKDNHWAHASLGRLYEEGKGVPKDILAAISHYRIGAELDNEAKRALERLENN